MITSYDNNIYWILNAFADKETIEVVYRTISYLSSC